jgi:hypothetical protein
MAQRLYQKRFPNRRPSHYSTFVFINQRLRETGSLNGKIHDCGRGRTILSPRLEAVLNMVADTPSTSTRRLRHAMHASHTAVWQVLHQRQLRPYHRKKFRQWAQRTTSGDKSLVSGFINAVLQRLGSPASWSTQMRRRLLERVLSTAVRTLFGWMKRNTRTRPSAKIFHQCLVWYCS